MSSHFEASSSSGNSYELPPADQVKAALQQLIERNKAEIEAVGPEPQFPNDSRHKTYDEFVEAMTAYNHAINSNLKELKFDNEAARRTLDVFKVPEMQPDGSWGPRGTMGVLRMMYGKSHSDMEIVSMISGELSNDEGNSEEALGERQAFGESAFFQARGVNLIGMITRQIKEQNESGPEGGAS